MRTESVVCDQCGKDLTSVPQGGVPRYRLALVAEAVPRVVVAGGLTAIPAVLVVNPLPVPLHFCGLPCLSAWAAGK